MFSCEFCEISKNTFFTEHLWTTASEQNQTNTLSKNTYIWDADSLSENSCKDSPNSSEDNIRYTLSNKQRNTYSKAFPSLQQTITCFWNQTKKSRSHYCIALRNPIFKYRLITCFLYGIVWQCLLSGPFRSSFKSLSNSKAWRNFPQIICNENEYMCGESVSANNDQFSII